MRSTPRPVCGCGRGCGYGLAPPCTAPDVDAGRHHSGQERASAAAERDSPLRYAMMAANNSVPASPRAPARSSHLAQLTPRSADRFAFLPARPDTLEDMLRRLPQRYCIPPAEVKRVRVLGSGTFGEVVLAEWLGTRVALKTQIDQTDVKKKPDVRSEFEVELSVLSEVSHSKIVRFLGACSSPPCIVLEYYGKGSLDDLLHRERMQLNVGQCLSIALDVALGMQYLHTRKVLHRDLKSQNVLIDGGLQARIADFGLAKFPFFGESSEDGITGTVPYMAPEILSRRSYGFVSCACLRCELAQS